MEELFTNEEIEGRTKGYEGLKVVDINNKRKPKKQEEKIITKEFIRSFFPSTFKNGILAMITILAALAAPLIFIGFIEGQIENPIPFIIVEILSICWLVLFTISNYERMFGIGKYDIDNDN